MTDVLVIVVLRILWICENNKTWRPHSILWQYTVSKFCLFLRNRMKEDCSTTPLPPTRELPNLDVGNQQSVLIFANGRKNTIAAKITNTIKDFLIDDIVAVHYANYVLAWCGQLTLGSPQMEYQPSEQCEHALHMVRREEYMLLRRIEVNPD